MSECIFCLKEMEDKVERMYIIIGRSQYPRAACKECLKARNLNA